MSGPPPAALLDFLGEAPSAAALRRPESGAGGPRPAAKGSAARRGEDSSPESPGLPPEDGGFDDCREYSGATAAETDTFGTAAAAGAAKSRSQRPPAAASKPPKGSPDTEKAARAAAGYSAGAQPKRAGSMSPEVEDFSKTATPAPGNVAGLLGEDVPSPARQRNPGEPHARPSGSGGSGRSGSGGSRPRSGSRNRSMGPKQGSRESGDVTPTKGLSQAAAALELDPLGSSMGRRRFGGRG
eukprot:TRINITY_DN91421_c0_g1_i1.p1 TRINITY_DN91421_c0_g1~~TRINITY_DN91421_c0_g1_i1.p1  ORF type:complete len:241 (+),score=46.20 TRINITY_DN91421_c0_g1_i1:62-784(+)